MIILVKFGEIILKGLNRHTFEKKLIANLKNAIGEAYPITSSQGVCYIDTQTENQEISAQIARKAAKIFGVISVNLAHSCEKNIDAIKAKTKEVCQNLNGTFKVEAKRADKKFSLTSPEISQIIGGFLDDELPNLTVNVQNPAHTIMLEIRETACYIYATKIKGVGGLPIGSSGRATLLLSGGIDSPVAGFMMAKRGLELNAVHFYSYPYTSLQAKQKVIDLKAKMQEYCGEIRLHIVPFTEIQLEINKSCPLDLSTIIMRVFMMKISSQIAENTASSALITGECLAQVASQTVQALAVTNHFSNLPVLRPLIGMDKEEIITIARQIGTFETSILPFEDCCTVFTPKHPVTKPKLDKIITVFEKLSHAALIEKAISNIEVV